MNGLGPEVQSVGKAIGLLNDGGLPSAAWFNNLLRPKSISTSPAQKAALSTCSISCFLRNRRARPRRMRRGIRCWAISLRAISHLTVANGSAPRSRVAEIAQFLR